MTDTRWTRRACDWGIGAVAWLWNRPHLITACLCFIAIAYTYHDGNKQDEAIQRNQVQALDQFCSLAEHSHRDDVVRLKEIYTYLDALPRAEYGAPLNQFIIHATLPTREADAHTDAAPPLCDEPGRGLREPDPVIPERPTDLRGPAFPPFRY